MNKNEFFQSTVQHLLTQVTRALNERGACMYRGQNGTKCAIGVHIADADYNPMMEDIVISRLVKQDFCPQNIKDLYAAFPELCSDLQWLHDDFMDNHHRFSKQALHLANAYSINPAYIPEGIK